jgi:hypothetical protein
MRAGNLNCLTAEEFLGLDYFCIYIRGSIRVMYAYLFCLFLQLQVLDVLFYIVLFSDIGAIALIPKKHIPV